MEREFNNELLKVPFYFDISQIRAYIQFNN